MKVEKGTQHTGETFFEMMMQRFREEQEDRREMHLQVGRTIVALSDIEQYLEGMFEMLSLPMPIKQSEKMFYGTQSFTRRLELVDYAASRSTETELHEPWEDLSERIKRQKVVRNIAAHASIHFRQEKGQRAKALIVAWSQSSKGKMQELGVPDVKKAADELEDIKKTLAKLYSRTIRVVVKARNIPLDGF